MAKIDVTLPAVFGDSSVIEGIERAADAGADGIEFFDWEGSDLDAVAEAAEERGVAIAGTLAGGGGSNLSEQDEPALTDPDSHETVVDDLERSIDAAETVGAETLIVTVGPDQEGLDRETQHEAIVDALSAVAGSAEAADATLVVEPLNTTVDHPGYYLTSSFEGYDIVEAVDNSHVKLLYDVYHQQITEGNVIQNIREHVDLIGHVHVADVPGRHEPGTGEINYENVLTAIDETGYDGYVGCEFMPEGDPDEAVRAVVEMAT